MTSSGEAGEDLRKAAVRRVVTLVALLNLAYFGIEFSVALGIKSVSLFADSVDFLEDASVNLLILLALSWSIRNRARLAMALALILLLPALATLWALWGKFTSPSVPEPFALSLTGAGALLVNLSCFTSYIPTDGSSWRKSASPRASDRSRPSSLRAGGDNERRAGSDACKGFSITRYLQR